MKVRNAIGLLAGLAILPSAFAAAYIPYSPPPVSTVTVHPGYFEIIGAVGGATAVAGTSWLGISSFETDTLVETNKNRWAPIGQVGIGYVYPFSRDTIAANSLQWFPSIGLQLNGYFASFKPRGDVLRFGSDDFNEFVYRTDINSSRLMLDTELTAATWRALSLFAIAGIGASWNNIDYSDTENGSTSCDIDSIHLDSHTSSNIAYELGGGLKLAVSSRIKVTLEYLYANLGRISTADQGHNNFSSFTVVPADFRLYSNEVLLGLRIAI